MCASRDSGRVGIGVDATPVAAVRLLAPHPPHHAPPPVKGADGLGFKVGPRKGAAVLFYNLLEDGNGDDLALHAALPVWKGEKWLANFWVRCVKHRSRRLIPLTPFIPLPPSHWIGLGSFAKVSFPRYHNYQFCCDKYITIKTIDGASVQAVGGDRDGDGDSGGQLPRLWRGGESPVRRGPRERLRPGRAVRAGSSKGSGRPIGPLAQGHVEHSILRSQPQQGQGHVAWSLTRFEWVLAPRTTSLHDDFNYT